jgi:peptide deformylase
MSHFIEWVPRRSIFSSKSMLASLMLRQSCVALWAGATPPLERRRGAPYVGAMSLRPILLHPDPRLRMRCAAVARITTEVGALAEDMLQTMYDAPGVGLAAPQVGSGLRLFVMDCAKEPDATPRPMVLVNPEITWASEGMNTYEEGCLSIPEHFAEITRPSEVRVRWTDLDGSTREEEFSGLWATCAQHEIDHLDGRLFIDHLGPIRRQMITRKMEKLKRERARS